MDLDTVIARARKVASATLGPEARSVDEERRWPEPGIRALQDMRLTGLTIPKDQEGLGYGLLALARVCEELGRKCASTSICFGMHAVGAAVIAAKATSIQENQLLTSMAEGKPTRKQGRPNMVRLQRHYALLPRGHGRNLLGLFSAKAEVAGCAVHVVEQAMALSGARGYRDGSTLHRMLRDVQASHIMAPSTDTLRSWTGRALLGLPILSG